MEAVVRQPSTTSPSLAVIGSGYWGKNLVRNFHRIGALKLICDRSEAVLSSFRSQYADVETCLALNDVLSRDDIRAVAVATPAETHFNISREALLAGKHVFTEKPLALRVTDAAALVDLAGDKGLTLMVGHLLQYHPVFQRLKELAESGELGRINYIYSNRLNLGKIRREENILWSFAPHDISMILTLAGEEPETVLATGGYYLHQRIADVTTTHLAFPSGLRAQVFVSWLHPFKEQKLVVVGDKKMAVFDDTQPWEDKLLLYAHQIQWQDHLPVPSKAEPERPDIPQDEPLHLECMHFLDAFTNGRTPFTNGREGLRVLKVLNAAQESLDNWGGAVPISSGEARAEPEPSPGKPFFVHETAVVDDDCEIGAGTRIWHFTHVLSGSRIGEKCNIGQNVMIGPDVTVGKGCKLQNNVSVYPGVTLEDYVFCGPSMVFTNVYNPRAGLRKMDQARATLVRKGATIGANATIVCGNTLGRYCFVGAGAVVNRNVQDYALVVGNPARRIGWVCECGERLPDDLICLTCGKAYKPSGNGITRGGD
ncbi:MAG: Gfo/Idh/MocA family oxidoreductase [Thermodesulfobacteriota bacterium]